MTIEDWVRAYIDLDSASEEGATGLQCAGPLKSEPGNFTGSRVAAALSTVAPVAASLATAEGCHTTQWSKPHARAKASPGERRKAWDSEAFSLALSELS